MTDGFGIPLGRVLAGANRHDSPLPGYDSATTRALLGERGLRGRIAHKGEKHPSRQASAGTSNAPMPGRTPFHRLACCYERRATVIDVFDLTATIITVRSLIRRAWITHRWNTRPPL